MSHLELTDAGLCLHLSRWEALAALRGSLEVSWSDVIEAQPDNRALRVALGIRLPGTWIPGLVVAGTYYWAHVWTFVFWRRGQQPLAIKVRGLRWSRLVIGVPDAHDAAHRINQRIALKG